jgi:RIO-like serine/threonine protein kinase
MNSNFQQQKTLKQDAFGSIEKGIFVSAIGEKIPAIRRMYTANIWLKPLARCLAANEKKALMRLAIVSQKTQQIPQLLQTGKNYHIRSYIEGDSMHRVSSQLSREFFIEAKKLLKTLRRAGVCNNDLAKEANWLITSDKNLPALTDFQLARCFNNSRNKLFLSLCREDLRHILKHKRKYYQRMTAMEQTILRKKAMISQIWMKTGKKLYLFVTRKILKWPEREGPEERNF